MRHVNKQALARAIELKAEEDDPAGIVTKALEDFQKTVDDRLKAVEGKGIDPKLTERLDKIEAKVNRPEVDKDKTQPTEERKAFGTYLRMADRAPAEELKTLTVSGDPQGGYLAPAELSTEFIRDLVEFSPIRPLATVRSTTAPSVSYPRRTGITNAKWKGETQAQEGSSRASDRWKCRSVRSTPSSTYPTSCSPTVAERLRRKSAWRSLKTSARRKGSPS